MSTFKRLYLYLYFYTSEGSYYTGIFLNLINFWKTYREIKSALATFCSPSRYFIAGVHEIRYYRFDTKTKIDQSFMVRLDIAVSFFSTSHHNYGDLDNGTNVTCNQKIYRRYIVHRRDDGYTHESRVTRFYNGFVCIRQLLRCFQFLLYYFYSGVLFFRHLLFPIYEITRSNANWQVAD